MSYKNAESFNQTLTQISSNIHADKIQQFCQSFIATFNATAKQQYDFINPTRTIATQTTVLAPEENKAETGELSKKFEPQSLSVALVPEK